MSDDPQARLDPLRTELAAIDREILALARAAAVEHGLSAGLGEELVLALIRGSLTVQEKDTVAAAGEGSGRRVLVIGGAGNMGRWFVRYLGAQGFTVEIADPTGRDS